MKKKFLFYFIIFVVIGLNINAHPGRTDSSGCHTCKTNCESWGLSYGEYHCHNGGTTSVDDSPSKPAPKKKKSGNNKISKIEVNGIDIEIKEKMNYSTEMETFILDVEEEDSKAKVTIKQPEKLKNGLNEIVISVKAENGKIKKYYLNITKLPSSNNSIAVSTEGTVIDFHNFESDVYKVEYTIDSIDLNYEIDDKASIKVIGNNNLKVGNNKIILRVTAENGNEQDYILNVEKEEEPMSFGYGLIALIIFLSIIILIIFIIKNLKKKNKKI